MRWFGAVVALLMIESCASVWPAQTGPNTHELAAALQLSEDSIELLRCEGLDEEPTEFICRYRRAGKAMQVFVALDGVGWIILDGPSWMGNDTAPEKRDLAAVLKLQPAHIEGYVCASDIKATEVSDCNYRLRGAEVEMEIKLVLDGARWVIADGPAVVDKKRAGLPSR